MILLSALSAPAAIAARDILRARHPREGEDPSGVTYFGAVGVLGFKMDPRLREDDDIGRRLGVLCERF